MSSRQKPHRGRIVGWHRQQFDPQTVRERYNEDPGLGYIVRGYFVGHPFLGGYGHTSWVVRSRRTKTGYQIETRNSRYFLVGEPVTNHE